MSGPIKTTDITGKPFWAIQEAFGKPITAYQMAGMLNAAIKHGIVSLPKPGMTECLVDSLEEIMNYTGGADSALDDEYVVERAQNAIARAKGGAE